MGGVNWNHPVRLSVQMSCKRSPSITDELILMKLYTVVVCDLRMSMEKDICGSKYLKGDDSSGDN